MMIGTTCLTHVLLFIFMKFVHSTVDPPEDVTITDLGHFGHMEIRWSPSPEGAQRRGQHQCLVLYELHYYDGYKGSWTSIRTIRTSFRAQFDLNQDTKVRIYTVLSGACVGGGIVKSKNYTEVIHRADMTGIDVIHNLTCLYFNMEHLVCSWRRSPKMPLKVQEALYYWHSDIPHAKECPCYVISGGFRSGCNFSGTDVPTFTDVNLCVNASSDDPIKPLYSSLQIQNIVKPKSPRSVRVEAGADRQLTVQWDWPTGRIPQHCLQYQLQTAGEEEGKHTMISSTEPEVKLVLQHNETSCVRVRCILNKYCAQGGVWSDWSAWSPSMCYTEKQSLASLPSRGMFPLYKYLSITIITGLMLALSVWAVCRLQAAKHNYFLP